VGDKTATNGGVQGDNPLNGARRQALVRAHQAQALQRPDPLAANLGVISGDLMGFAHVLAPAVQADLERTPTSAQSHRRFTHEAELYLKIVRQIDRLARIERQLSEAAQGQEKCR